MGPRPGATGYTSRWAFDDSQERAAFEAVIDVILERWAADPAMHVYHFGHYEPAALKRLMGRYATRADAIDRLLRGERFVDLHAIVRHALRAGVESYSLKKLEPLYGFGREVALDDAAAHLRAVEMALEANAAAIIPPSTREAIEGYNRDDCRSARALRDWLEQVRAGQVAAGFEITRPAPPSEAPSERVTQLDADVETLRAQLLEKVPLEASERDQAQQVRWMLAYLIDWHRRESKAEWWEYFRLCELPEEELLDESLAIAGLTFVQNVEIVRHSKTGRPTGSVVDRYRYPAQDVEIRRKGKLKLQDGRPLGEVVAIDRDARLIDIRKGPECAELHPSSVFSASVVPTEGPQRSVMRVASGVVAGESSCAADLLYRRSPRLHSEPFSSRAGEPVVERLVRLITDLHDTTLAIQGPPGAGKTYAGARMICRLIAEGRQVGWDRPGRGAGTAARPVRPPDGAVAAVLLRAAGGLDHRPLDQRRGRAFGRAVAGPADAGRQRGAATGGDRGGVRGRLAAGHDRLRRAAAGAGADALVPAALGGRPARGAKADRGGDRTHGRVGGRHGGGAGVQPRARLPGRVRRC